MSVQSDGRKPWIFGRAGEVKTTAGAKRAEGSELQAEVTHTSSTTARAVIKIDFRGRRERGEVVVVVGRTGI